MSDYTIKECQLHGAYVADTCPRCDDISMTTFTRCREHNISYKQDAECPQCVKKQLSHTKTIITGVSKPAFPASWTATSIELSLPIVREGVDVWYVRQYKSRKNKRGLRKTKKDYDAFYYGGHWHSIFELWFYTRWEITGLPMPITEYRFHSKRQWKFDFAWLDSMIAVELEGGVHSYGRHTRGQGYKNDLEKYNAATAAGWQVYRFADKKSEHIEFMKARFKAVEKKDVA